jgi:hypothetical protein
MTGLSTPSVSGASFRKALGEAALLEILQQGRELIQRKLRQVSLAFRWSWFSPPDFQGGPCLDKLQTCFWVACYARGQPGSLEGILVARVRGGVEVSAFPRLAFMLNRNYEENNIC